MSNICCGGKLETGGEILGWIGIIFYGLIVIYSFPAFIAGTFGFGMACSISNDPMAKYSIRESNPICGVLSYLLLAEAIAVIGLLVHILLIRGIVIRNHNFVLSAFIFGIIMTALLLIGSFATGEGIIIFLAIIAAAPLSYFLVVQFFLFLKIKSDDQSEWDPKRHAQA